MGKAVTALSAFTIALVGISGSARADFTVASNLPAGYSTSSFFIGVGFTGNTGNGFFANEAAAQEFTASASGVLTTLQTTVEQINPGGVSLNVSIFTASGGLPGALLGSALFTPGQVSSNASTTPSNFDLSSANISLTAGQSYLVTFTVATPIASDARYGALLLNSNSIFFGIEPLYSKDGTAWLPEGLSNEIGLTVNARAVPEPSTLVLTSLGFVAIGLRRARRRRLAA